MEGLTEWHHVARLSSQFCSSSTSKVVRYIPAQRLRYTLMSSHETTASIPEARAGRLPPIFVFPKCIQSPDRVLRKVSDLLPHRSFSSDPHWLDSPQASMVALASCHHQCHWWVTARTMLNHTRRRRGLEEPEPTMMLYITDETALCRHGCPSCHSIRTIFSRQWL